MKWKEEMHNYLIKFTYLKITAKKKKKNIYVIYGKICTFFNDHTLLFQPKACAVYIELFSSFMTNIHQQLCADKISTLFWYLDLAIVSSYHTDIQAVNSLMSLMSSFRQLPFSF